LKITISHPHGNPNSFHAARAFAEADWLLSFQRGVTGEQFLSSVMRKFSDDAAERLSNRRLVNVSTAQQRSHIFWETASRLGTRLKPKGLTPRVNWYDLLFCGHDLQVSRQLEDDLDAVYAYEDCARRTFDAARNKHAATVYELPLGYYDGVARELERAQRERPEFSLDFKTEPEWKRRRKDAELGLADIVVVPCAWAAASLQHSKVGSRKTTIKIPYGTPANEVPSKTERTDAPFTVLFAGQVGLRKGIPHLLEAWKRLGLKNAQLWLAGSMNLDNGYLREVSESAEYLGKLSRVRLLEAMRRADLLVFPSLAEGFGLVIGEAMASGLPVLTTTHTGGVELITDGHDGWLVEAHDSQALQERIEWAAHHRDELFEMGRRARLRAEQWTWGHYRRALVEELSRHLN
jgi:glycosyltransferase involved in cell wall biosynthesis